MKFIIGILLLITINMSIAQRIPIDKQKHLYAGFIIGGVSTYIPNKIHPIVNAILVSTTIGVSKESYDIITGNGVYDKRDIYATVIGGGIGGTITYSLQKLLKNRKKRTHFRRWV